MDSQRSPSHLPLSSIPPFPAQVVCPFQASSSALSISVGIRFLEYGNHKGHLYGTSFDAIADVLDRGMVCVVDIDPEVSGAGVCLGRNGATPEWGHTLRGHAVSRLHCNGTMP